MKLDLNCDLGEGESLARTRSLMRWITSANVACGGHAGDLRTMRTCIRLARHFGVRLGAHPGPWSRDDRGRGAVKLTPDEFELLLLRQVGALEQIARRHEMTLHHIKLHGGLYHLSEQDESIARRYLRAVRQWWPGCIIYARAGGRIARAAKRAGVRVWDEAFADRNYRDDASLVSRDDPRALITKVAMVRERVHFLLESNAVRTISGRILNLHPRTLCLHSDTPNAPALARAVAELRRWD